MTSTRARVKAKLVRLKRSLRDSSRHASRIAADDWEGIASALRGQTPPDSGHVLVASSGVRNTGDQAMLDAFLTAVPGRVTVVTQPQATYDLHKLGPQSTEVKIEGLLQPSSREHNTAVARLADLIRMNRTISIIGADIIDGGYHRGVAASLWAMAGAAAEAGRDARVLGFSWNTEVDGAVVQAAARATSSGVRAMVRDPHSVTRAVSAGLSNVRAVADAAFTLPNPERSTEPKCVALLNVSGLIRSRIDLRADYREILRYLLESGLDVVITPHVDGPGGSDVAAGREFWSSLPPRIRDVVTLREELVSPDEVKRLASTAQVTITGRMHLGVLSMSMGVPAIVLGTQGKVHGLMDLVGLPDWALEPTTGVGARAVRLLDRFATDSTYVHKMLNDRVPIIRELAWRNYDGLHEAPPRS